MAASVSVTSAARRLGISMPELGDLIGTGRISPDHDGRLGAGEVAWWSPA